VIRVRESRAEKFGENTDASPMAAAAAAAAATAARIAAAEAQNAEYREAKILQTDGNAKASPPGWALTQVELALDVDLDRQSLGGAALLTVAPSSGTALESMAELELDVHQLAVRAVGLPSEGLDELPFSVSPAGSSGAGTLRVELPPPSPGWGWSTLVLKVEYSACGGPGLRWIGGDSSGNKSGGPLLFAGHETASIFPCMEKSAAAVTHSAVVTVAARSAAAARGLKALMCAADDTVLLQTLVQRGLATGDSPADAATAQPQPEPEPEPGSADEAVTRVFTLRVSDPIPSSALTLAVGCLERIEVRRDGGNCAGCGAPPPWCCCCAASIGPSAETDLM
jgi:hypothetical protein